MSTLATMEPNPVWDAESYADTVETLREHDDVVYKVWGGDWCKDCRSQLPDFGAALDAAGVPADRVEHYPVEKAADGSKVGPRVEEYGIELIPTVVVERVGESGGAVVESEGEPGEELARFVESADAPIAVFLARKLRSESR